MTKEQLINNIKEYIYPNNEKKISDQILQDVLVNMVENLAEEGEGSFVKSDGTVTTMISLTQSEYDALQIKDSKTVYIIKNS